ncbi:MAG: hypothetical protein DWQ49_11900 [Bacteroidetes bacterium]|nr:MAG: hypothetical protein DWQ49_11900 [Bacteroidota bacterium]|tara:strand:- start:131 stop:631 length:501 start_codon:yes stop_codon:yes gene_type:complete
MANRSIFNRRYTSYTPGSTQVWLVNGQGVTTSPTTTLDFTAGETLIQGEVVYVSGAVVLGANAASGAAPELYNPIGITNAAAAATETVGVILDSNATISSSNLIHESAMTPGQYYYLAREKGKLVSADAPSGITMSGGYSAVVPLGLALSTSELQVEIQGPIILVD